MDLDQRRQHDDRETGTTGTPHRLADEKGICEQARLAMSRACSYFGQLQAAETESAPSDWRFCDSSHAIILGPTVRKSIFRLGQVQAILRPS
jgi:hypothetical protein